MRLALYSSPFVPEEWLSAHGFLPTRFTHAQSPAALTEGCCGFAMEFLSEANEQNYDVIISATTCDQMRHVPELMIPDKPVFLMNVPSTWQSAGSFKLYISELKRLGEFLCAHGGIPPDSKRLKQAMLDAEELRQMEVSRKYSRKTDVAIPLAVTGGPLLINSTDLIQDIEAVGGSVVLDATESGEMTTPPPFDKRRLESEPFDVLSEAYFSIPDIGQRPNSRYYTYLEQELSKRDIRGLIIHRYTWCDLWHAEVQRIKEWASIPVLDLGGDHAQAARATTKIQAFMEMLRD